MCGKKEVGGLGCWKARENNSAFIMKLGWELLAKSNDLWVRVLKGKYCKGSLEHRQIRRRKTSSSLWKGICDVWHLVEKGLSWAVGDGRKVRFWEDRWVSPFPNLLDYATREITTEEKTHKVSSFLLYDGSWDLRKMSNDSK